MIRITLNKSTISIKGHADYAEQGKDIVCASVSTVFQLAKMGLLQLAKQYPKHIEVEIMEED